MLFVLAVGQKWAADRKESLALANSHVYFDRRQHIGLKKLANLVTDICVLLYLHLRLPQCIFPLIRFVLRPLCLSPGSEDWLVLCALHFFIYQTYSLQPIRRFLPIVLIWIACTAFSAGFAAGPALFIAAGMGLLAELSRGNLLLSVAVVLHEYFVAALIYFAGGSYEAVPLAFQIAVAALIAGYFFFVYRPDALPLNDCSLLRTLYPSPVMHGVDCG